MVLWVKMRVAPKWVGIQFVDLDQIDNMWLIFHNFSIWQQYLAPNSTLSLWDATTPTTLQRALVVPWISWAKYIWYTGWLSQSPPYSAFGGGVYTITFHQEGERNSSQMLIKTQQKEILTNNKSGHTVKNNGLSIWCGAVQAFSKLKCVTQWMGIYYPSLILLLSPHSKTVLSRAYGLDFSRARITTINDFEEHSSEFLYRVSINYVSFR